jgi:hypothetical protein
MAEVTPQDIQQLQLLIDEARKSTGHLLTPPDERESGILKYEGDQPVECVDVKSYGPSHDRRTASQAAHDVIVGARMLSMAIADQPLTKVVEGISP